MQFDIDVSWKWFGGQKKSGLEARATCKRLREFLVAQAARRTELQQASRLLPRGGIRYNNVILSGGASNVRTLNRLVAVRRFHFDQCRSRPGESEAARGRGPLPDGERQVA